MSKKQTHGPIPKGNQSRHAIEPQKREVEENAQEQTSEETRPLGDVADEHGRVKLPPEQSV
jgi:hypothetical protein